MKVDDWNQGYAHEVATWHYEPPWDFYDLASDPDDAVAMHDPANRRHYRAVVADDGHVEAFWYFDWHEDVVEIGIGLRPDLTGRGRGESFLRAQLDYAADHWKPLTYRLFVAAWNERAIRAYRRLGFREVARETRHFRVVGEHEFIRMERSA